MPILSFIESQPPYIKIPAMPKRGRDSIKGLKRALASIRAVEDQRNRWAI